jgi:hypothetical protein
MSQVAFEIVILFLLLLANGVFAMAEISVVSSNKARLRRLADQGNGKARVALELAESPNRFLSTVQIGITLVVLIKCVQEPEQAVSGEPFKPSMEQRGCPGLVGVHKDLDRSFPSGLEIF